MGAWYRNLDLIITLALSFLLLLTSAFTRTYMAYPLLAALILFMLVLLRRGFGLQALVKMGVKGARQAVPVVQVLLLIGLITAVWMAAGTVPALVYYGTALIAPRFFILWAFVLTSGVSVLTGTAFGSVGTIGLALMVMARSSGADTSPVAGAIIAGAFVGDRCSLLSSSAHLVASVTGTSLHTNLRNMVKTSLWPLLLSLLFYSGLSLFHPVQFSDSSIAAKLPELFDLSPIVLLPAVAMLLLALLRVDVKLAMFVSIGLGVMLARSHQHYSLFQIVQFMTVGYQLNQTSPLQAVLVGGGLLPMLKATVIVFISTTFAGIVSGSRVLGFVNPWLSQMDTARQRAQATVLVSLFANIFGCTQTIAIVLTGKIMQPHYAALENKSLVRYTSEQLAIDLEDSAVVIAPLIPWNIAGLIPATILSVSPAFIPYAVYLFLVPLCCVLRSRKPLERVSDVTNFLH
ncbi:MAG: Na+/H+ antiporter NhaC family protein [Cyanobacteria bacterium J06607_10]